MGCLPYRKIENTVTELSKGELNILASMVKSEIVSLKYLKHVSNEFVSNYDIDSRETILDKLEYMIRK